MPTVDKYDAMRIISVEAGGSAQWREWQMP